MTPAICRYGARVIPNTVQTIEAMRRAGTLIEGPHIAAFEAALATRLGVARVTTASYGRMAFYYLLRAFDFPRGSEIIVPALTFWAVPEIARAAGLTPVFADVDPATFNIDVRTIEPLITSRTRAIVPTHLYGLPCDMDGIDRLAAKYGLKVIEDAAHALGATYRGRPAGTLGDAAFFSFQTLKPLNTYRGGAAYARDPVVAARVASLAAGERWPSEARIRRVLLMGKAQRVLTRPRVFTWTVFPLVWCASRLPIRTDAYLWEPIRPLTPLPASYTERYSNVQAALGLEGLKYLDTWTATTRAHAGRMSAALAGIPGVTIPRTPADTSHSYYQYCAYVPDREVFVQRCLERGVDVETLHMDVWPALPLFGQRNMPPGAKQTQQAVQLPIYQALTDAEIDRVIEVARWALGAGVEGAPQGAMGRGASRAHLPSV